MVCIDRGVDQPRAVDASMLGHLVLRRRRQPILPSSAQRQSADRCVGGFLENSSGARVVADLPYNSRPAGTIVQPRLAPALAKSMFNSPGLSLALQTNTDGQGEISHAGGSEFELPATRNKEEEYESRFGSDDMDGASGDDQDADNPPRKKRYHRHTPQQIQELEALFKECPHPDEKQRLELSKRLCLESRQVKFWFQNHRTQMKTQLERYENSILRQENERLRKDNAHLTWELSQMKSLCDSILALMAGYANKTEREEFC